MKFILSAGVKPRAFLLGVLAAVSQLLILRELMSSLYGNELLYAGLMAAWVLGIALGARFHWPRMADARILFVIGSVFSVVSVFCIGHLRLWLGWPTGQMQGIGVMLAVSAGMSLPVCLVWGALFSTLARDEGEGAYAAEALGFAAGGLLMCAFLASPLNQVSREARAPQWPGYKVLAAAETPYASLVVVRRGGENSLFENGIHTATSGDALTAEETVHYALLAHPSPRRLLLIGGVASGAVGEALKHPGVMVDVVELDAGVVALVMAYFPDVARTLGDARVRVLAGDARRLLRGMKAGYDVVIVSAGDPVSLLANRYYTREFLTEIQGVLSSGGIVAAGSTASEDYVNDEGRRMLAGLYVTLKSVFGGVEVVPGERYLFMAGSGKIDPAILAHRLAERGVHTQYVRPEFFKERLSSRRMQQARDLVVDVKGVINTDLRPSAMIDALAYQSTRTGSRFSSVVEVFRTFAIWLWLLPAGVFLLARRKRGTTGAALVTAGFCQMLLQTGMLIMFQAVFGNVYVLLGGLMALFMLGLACGAWRSPVKRALSRAALSGAAVLVLAAALAPIVVAYKSWAAIYFCVVPLLAGYCGGWLFRAVLRQSGSAGQAYALDVVGAAPGALLGGILLIPLWGLPLALAFAGVLQLAVFLAQD